MGAVIVLAAISLVVHEPCSEIILKHYALIYEAQRWSRDVSVSQLSDKQELAMIKSQRNVLPIILFFGMTMFSAAHAEVGRARIA